MATVTRSDPQTRIPPLENGDRLTTDEFLRRYERMHGVRAELIEGVVYMASPVSIDHSEPLARATFWITAYTMTTPGVVAGNDGTIRLDLDNCPQPDISLRITPQYGGQAKENEDRIVVGAPELVVEVARSTVSIDLHDKMRAYCRNHVREYIVWRVDDRRIDWFVLREGRYDAKPLSADGVYRSDVFPGLWLDPDALIRSDLSIVLQNVQQGLASPEHAAFVEILKANAAKTR